MLAISLLSLIVVLFNLRLSWAQTTNASCFPEYAWMYNGLGQSPCLVSAHLGAVCNGGQYFVVQLGPNQHYIGPTTQIANDCQCSTVFYSMMSACGTCQNMTILSWTSWSANCSTPSIALWPEPIPPQTRIPAWAYLDVTTANTFDPVAARLRDNLPESTATVQQSTARPQPSATGTQGAPRPPTGKSSNTGAIAGGVTGAVVGSIIIGLVVYFVMKKKKVKGPGGKKLKYNASPHYGTAYHGLDTVPEMADLPPPTLHSTQQSTRYTPHSPQYSTPPQTSPQRSTPSYPWQQQPAWLYDPNDPRTFPDSPTNGTFTTNQPPLSAVTPSTGHPHSAVSYSGQPLSAVSYPGQPSSAVSHIGQPSSGISYPGQPLSAVPYAGHPPLSAVSHSSPTSTVPPRLAPRPTGHFPGVAEVQ